MSRSCRATGCETPRARLERRYVARNFAVDLRSGYARAMNGSSETVGAAERRTVDRRSADLFFNKFLDGHPFLCRTLDVSERGALVETFAEPASAATRFPVELRVPGGKQTLWLWARCVRRTGR